MIELTRLNGKPFMLNAFPDTTITLTSGSKYIVLESEQEVKEKIIALYRQVQVLSNPYLRGEENE